MATTKEKLWDRLDQLLIEACEHAEEIFCGVPTVYQAEYSELSERGKCALTFIRQWASGAKLPIALLDLDTVLVLRFQRSAPMGDHVHERLFEGFNHLLSKPGNWSDESVAEHAALARMNEALKPSDRAKISAAFQTVFNVQIVLNVDPHKRSFQTAVFLLAKLLDPDLGE